VTSFARDAGLERLAADRFDVLVVGGGITGAGVALDAASRGLRTALVERHDFGSGTSSQSSKLVHGGLRYLSQGDYRLVAQALAERQRLLENAPHLVRPLPFLIPAYRSRAKMRAISTALWTYDLIGGFRIGSLHRRLSVADTLARTPALRADGLVGGHLYMDAQADDARLTLAVVRTAVLDHRAVAVNHVAVREVRAGAGAVVDAGGGREIEVRASVVVNATGVLSDSLAGAGAGDGAGGIRPAKGVHVTLPAALVPTSVALVLPVPADGRSIFVVPWPGTDRVYIGTTDTDYDGPLDAPACTAEDTAYLLDAVNAALTTTLTAGDVVGSWAGLRPLIAGAGAGRSADLSRRHRVTRSADGVVTITGGKLTTYRAMAADTVDEVQAALGRPPTRSRTAGLALRGASASSDHLSSRYGSEARVVEAIISGDATLAQPLVPTLPYLRAEAVFAARYEMAGTLDDVLSRRTRARILAREPSLEAAAGVAELLAPELGWDAAETEAQVRAYRAGVG
jgi:glycerol-3-phosphate dehydrogenase